MTPERAQQLLHALAQQWRRKIYAGYVLKSIGLALLVTAGFSANLNWSGLDRILMASFVFVVGLAVRFWLNRKKSIDAALLARHLNRVMPELEETCELLLKPETTSTVLENLQRQRLLKALNEQQARLSLPRQALRSSWRFLGVSSALALLVVVVAPLLASKENDRRQTGLSLQSPHAANDKAENLALKIESAHIEIVPPSYTGKTKRAQTKFELNIEEGAQIIWLLTLNQKIENGVLILNESDTLKMQQRHEMTYAIQTQIKEGGFYYFILNGTTGATLRSDYYKLDVIKDSPPVITFTSSEQRTEIAPGQPLFVNLHAVADDDYALSQAEIIATLTHGAGEAIKFREDTLAFGTIKKDSPQHWNLRESLDLQNLGMAPGDELYFFVEVRDNRMPENNRSRSEIYFIVLPDTARLELALSTGLAINPLPEYFRSQRQIIIDTEKLIKEKNQISATEFKNHSNNLGLDQQALRLRYGEFLGEESNSGVNRRMEYGADEIEEPEKPNRPKTEKENATIMSVVEQFMHEHDAEANATRLAQSVKDKLKAALAEMWDAELHLRTHQPEAALPYEYRALKLLKDVQQQSRVYVQRVGFEPAPIKVDEKRLNGDLSKINNRRAEKDFPENKSLPNARQALHLLQRLKSHPNSSTPEEVKILEKAGQDLARLAAEQPGRHLEALQNLRTLITSLNDKKDFCDDCLALAAQAFWNILPPEKPIPSKRTTASFGLSRLYFQKMGATP